MDDPEVASHLADTGWEGNETPDEKDDELNNPVVNSDAETESLRGQSLPLLFRHCEDPGPASASPRFTSSSLLAPSVVAGQRTGLELVEPPLVPMEVMVEHGILGAAVLGACRLLLQLML